MEYVRKIDFATLATIDDQIVLPLVGPDAGLTGCSINCIKTPPGGGSPPGLHTHPVDQVFYVLSGEMRVEIAGHEYEGSAGTLIVFPANVPHRNWNAGSEATLHLAINSPLPEPGTPFTRPA